MQLRADNVITVHEHNTSKVEFVWHSCYDLWLTSVCVCVCVNVQMDVFSAFGMELTAPVRSSSVFNRAGSRRRLSRGRRRIGASGDRIGDSVYKYRYNMYLPVSASVDAATNKVRFAPLRLQPRSTTHDDDGTPAAANKNNAKNGKRAKDLSTQPLQGSESSSAKRSSVSVSVSKPAGAISRGSKKLAAAAAVASYDVLRLGFHRDASACLAIFLRHACLRNFGIVPLQLQRTDKDGKPTGTVLFV